MRSRSDAKEWTPRGAVALTAVPGFSVRDLADVSVSPQGRVCVVSSRGGSRVLLRGRR